MRGAGHHTIGRAIFGHTRIASGRLTLDGEPIAPQSPAEAMAKGVGFVSSRRAEEGLASNLDVRENIYMNPAASGKGVMEFIPRATELSEAQAAVRRFSIKTAGVEEPVATLSGGNQQKVVLARWMEAHVKLSFSRSRRSASTSAQRRTFTTCCSCRCAKDWRLC